MGLRRGIRGGLAARDARTASYSRCTALSLRKKRSSTKLENTSLSTDAS